MCVKLRHKRNIVNGLREGLSGGHAFLSFGAFADFLEFSFDVGEGLLEALALRQGVDDRVERDGRDDQQDGKHRGRGGVGCAYVGDCGPQTRMPTRN